MGLGEHARTSKGTFRRGTLRKANRRGPESQPPTGPPFWQRTGPGRMVQLRSMPGPKKRRGPQLADPGYRWTGSVHLPTI